MKILPADDAGIAEALAALSAGGVVAHATETCYGLACDLSDPKAIARLFRIKQRAVDQPVSALFSSIEQAKQFVIWNERAEALAREHLPGPLTLVLPFRHDARLQLFPTPNGGESLGVRVSPHPVAIKLATMFGKPLSTTSANVSGSPNPYSPAEIENQFLAAQYLPDIILDSGTLPPTPPSRVIDLTKGDEVVLRD